MTETLTPDLLVGEGITIQRRILGNIEDPGVNLIASVVDQEERSSVSIDQPLSLVHHLDNQCVHADHLLEY